MCHTSSSIVISSSSIAFEVEMVPSANPRKQSRSNRSGRSQGISTGSSNGGRVQRCRDDSLYSSRARVAVKTPTASQRRAKARALTPKVRWSRKSSHQPIDVLRQPTSCRSASRGMRNAAANWCAAFSATGGRTSSTMWPSSCAIVNLDASVLKDLNQIRDRRCSEPPVGAEVSRGMFHARKTVVRWKGGRTRPVPAHVRYTEGVFHREIAFKPVEYSGLNSGLLASTKFPSTPESDLFSVGLG